MRWKGGPAVAGLLLLAACGGASSGEGGAPEVEVVEGVTGPRPPLVAVGDVLLAAPRADESGVDGTTGALQRSDDGGRTWEPFGLPDAPARLEVGLQHLPGADLAVATGREVVDSLDMQVPGGGTYVWTSADGRAWHGGLLVAGAPPFLGVTVAAPVDDVLLAGVGVGGDLVHTPSRYTLHRSDDGGATWTEAEVALDLTIAVGGRMELIDAWSPEAGRLVAHLGLGRVAFGPFPDGATEAPSGPDAETAGPAGAAGPPTTVVTPGGPGSTAPPPSSSPPRPFGEVPAVLASDDGGRTWALAPCPADAIDPSGTACSRPDTYGGLLVDGHQVSVDGGGTWAPPTVEGEPVDDDFSFGDVVELDGGGWLATATEDNDETSRGFLLRSDDGTTWERLLPDAEDACDVPLDSTGFRGPVPFDGGWLVTHGCSDFHDPVSAEAYTLAADGTDPTPVAGTRRDQARYDDVLLVDGTATLLATRADGTADLVLITPG